MMRPDAKVQKVYLYPTRLAPTDGMNHEAAVLFELDSVEGAPGAPPLRLPETSNGLGYQNLISMIFRLMAFRDEWLKKFRSLEEQSIAGVEPIHLVLIEEPEAHLHVQVQQAFVKHAYHVLCNDALLEQYPNLKTQLVVSSHSSHVAHEMDYGNLRYFRRLPSGMAGVTIPVSTVSNLSTEEVEALPNTFEDSLVLSNVTHFAGKAGRGLVRSFGKALRDSETPQDLGAALFNKLRDGDKAEFALHVLGDPDFADLSIPAYIHAH